MKLEICTNRKVKILSWQKRYAKNQMDMVYFKVSTMVQIHPKCKRQLNSIVIRTWLPYFYRFIVIDQKPHKVELSTHEWKNKSGQHSVDQPASTIHHLSTTIYHPPYTIQHLPTFIRCAVCLEPPRPLIGPKGTSWHTRWSIFLVILYQYF